ncbi:MAG: hypothetical protein JW958_03290 [Candidatus Eisenbacteria bacterium]|nr:hypothetical protein [Candidatus Eisenbacteria bacterium]
MRSTRSLFSISAERAVRRGALFLAAWATAWATAPSAYAEESGGTESPFAFGAGARALALGGAYVALAEGPAGVTWNPAGMAGAKRKEMTFFYTSPFVEGNRYAFFGYVHPFLDRGTVSFANLRYGMDDIRRFDAGGAEDGVFTDRQNEWILAYALPPLGPVRIGANLKAETHALDGRSATSFGADLGIQVGADDGDRSLFSRRNLRFGLAIRNVLEPTLAMADGEDRLPRLLRAGAALRVPLAGGDRGEALLLAGLDQGKESGGRARFGVEYRLPGGIAFRGGADGEEWAAGLGLSFHAGRFDYAFASRELGDAHRFGVTLSFGAPLDTLRERRRAEEEERLARRTGEELERKEREQIDADVLDAEKLLKAGDFIGAEARFERALLWDDADERALAGLGRARTERHVADGDARLAEGNLLEAVAAYRAALAVSPEDERAARRLAETTDRLNRSAERSREVSEHLTRGVEYLALSDLLRARDEFDAAIEIAPDNPDASSYRVRTDSLIALRIDDLVEEAAWFRDRGRPETAKDRYREALALRPDRDDLVREIARLEAPAAEPETAGEGGAATATEAAPERRREPTPEEREEAGRMYRSGVDALGDERYDEAVRYFQFVYGLAPDYENVRSYLKQAHLFLGMDRYTEGDMSEAIREWERILEIDPEDEKALSYVRRARLEIRKAKALSGG